MSNSSTKETIQFWKRRRRGLIEEVDFYKATKTQKQHGAFLFNEAEKFDKKEKVDYVYICDCKEANIAAYGTLPKHNGGPNPGKDHSFSMALIKPKGIDKTCPYCGYYAKLISSTEIGDCGAFGRGMRGKNKSIAAATGR